MAVRKKVAKKRVAKKRVAKKRVAKKRVSKKKVTLTRKKAAAKKRTIRAARKSNPIAELFHIKIVKGNKVYYFTGEKGDTEKKNAALYRNGAMAKRIAQQVSNTLGDSAKVYVEGTVVKK